MAYVTRHAECRAVLRDTSSFSNASGMKAPGVAIPREDRILGELDPPDHTRVRRVMVTALTPKTVHDAESFIRSAAGTLLDAARDAVERNGVVDLVTAFTVPLPNRVTVHLLGFPSEDADLLARLAKELMESEFPLRNRTERGEGFANAFPEIRGLHRRTDRSARASTATRRSAHGCRVPSRPARGRWCAADENADSRAHAQPDHRRTHDDEPADRERAARAAHEAGCGRRRAVGQLRARHGDRGKPAPRPTHPVRRTGMCARHERRRRPARYRRAGHRRHWQREPRRAGVR